MSSSSVGLELDASSAAAAFCSSLSREGVAVEVDEEGFFFFFLMPVGFEPFSLRPPPGVW